jgi:hypothetical protein
MAEKHLSSIAKDNDNAQYQLGKLYLREEKKELAEKQFLASAKQNNAYAQYQLGKMYLDPADLHLRKAEKYLTASAEQGIAPAYYWLGKMYMHDDFKNLPMAEKYLSSIANDNNNAQYLLGKLYLREDYKDLDKARMWLKLSADNGNVQGQFSYGVLEYKLGNHQLGKQYLQLSADNGNKFAGKVLENINRVRISKPPRVRQAVQRSYKSSQACWNALSRIMDEYESHIKKLQAEFDYENNISSDDDYYDEGYTYSY